MAHGAARAGALIALAAGAFALFLGAAAAQSNGARTATQAERDRQAAQAEALRLRDRARDAAAEIADLNTRLVQAGARRTEAEAAAADAEARLAALQARARIDGLRYRHSRDAFESALMAAAFAERDANLRAVRAGVFARASAPALRGWVRQSSDAVEEARRLDQSIATEQQIIADAQEAIDAERAEILMLVAQRRASQVSLSNDAASAERRARQFATEARSLRDLARRVEAATRPRGGGSGAAGGGTVPAAWLAPAEGRIARAFGTREGAGPAAQGVTLRTRAGAQVVAPASGEVAYAGLFRSYGQVLILNLDGGYALVLTGMGTVRARVGEAVLAGQPVGEMPSSDTPAPELYVEVRRQGRLLDPARWLSSRGLAAERRADAAG